MHKRFWLSIAMLAIGTSMLAATALGSPSRSNSQQAKNGGTAKFVFALDVENVDPARSYYVPEWQYEWVTGRMLLNYAHKTGSGGYRLTNDGAKSYSVSKNGKVYTFHIRHGMKFSDGEPLNAVNYKHAFMRILNPAVGSPIASFLTDTASVNIVGGIAYNKSGKGNVAGLQTKGKYTFIIKLVKPAPLLLGFTALPPTMAQPLGFAYSPITKVPFDSGGKHFSQLPSGGRYYIASRTPNRSLVIKKNTHYKALGAAPTPGHISQFVYTMGVEANQALLLIKSGQADWQGDNGLDPSVWGGLFQQYGKSGRARAFATSCVAYVSMNTSKGTFKNLSARKAVGWGISRKAFVALDGTRGGQTTSQLLTPPIPGYKKTNIFPATANLSKAKKFAKGHTGHVELWHTTSNASILRAQLLQSELKAMGFNNIEQKTVAGGSYYTDLGKKGTSYDIARAGWCADFPDPYDYLNKLFSGRTIQDVQNNNLSYFSNAKVDRQLQAAAQLRPPKRYKTYGNLDVSIMRKYVPVANYEITNERDFWSAKVATNTIKVSNIYGVDLGQLALK